MFIIAYKIAQFHSTGGNSAVVLTGGQGIESNYLEVTGIRPLSKVAFHLTLSGPGGGGAESAPPKVFPP